MRDVRLPLHVAIPDRTPSVDRPTRPRRSMSAIAISSSSASTPPVLRYGRLTRKRPNSRLCTWQSGKRPTSWSPRNASIQYGLCFRPLARTASHLGAQLAMPAVVRRKSSIGPRWPRGWRRCKSRHSSAHGMHFRHESRGQRWMTSVVSFSRLRETFVSFR